MEQKSANDIFKEFKSHSISEFFKRNSQMLGYAGRVRSLTTVVHEYVTNSLDACEEAGILPEIFVEIKEVEESKHLVTVRDNGPGIPSQFIGKALASILSGTKFHRYLQQRGQQGIGASGCTLFAQITTGKGVHVVSRTSSESFECDVAIDVNKNEPIITNFKNIEGNGFTGLEIIGLFGETKYENSERGVLEYLKRTALVNPHANITLKDPDGKEHVFVRTSNILPERPKESKPHPLGITTSDLMYLAELSSSRYISTFLVESLSRVTKQKIDELKNLIPDIDLEKSPHELTWEEGEKIVRALKKIKWMAPETDTLSLIGKEQIEKAISAILMPEFVSTTQRRPRVYMGGIPFVVEAAIAYGGKAGKEREEFRGGEILRFANKVPLLFDSANCAITEAVKSIDWSRYGIKNFDEEPVSVLVNISSVYVPYSGVGKQAVAEEEEIIDEIKLAVMECARDLQRYLNGVKRRSVQESKYKTIMRYVNQLSDDLSAITRVSKDEIKEKLISILKEHYSGLFEEETNETKDN